MSEPEPQPRDPLIGASLDGRYTIRELLGRGGMGVVYAGVHDQLQRAVAIKVLNAAWAADPSAVERFLREARTASSFTHGNIVPVTDLGRLPDGRPYSDVLRVGLHLHPSRDRCRHEEHELQQDRGSRYVTSRCQPPRPPPTAASGRSIAPTRPSGSARSS